MTGATVFSGIGAPEVGIPYVEWKWNAEIEKFPSSVLASRWPHVPNLGDVTAADFINRAQSFGAIDILVGGFPCQAFSVAGLRKSLSDDRGNLSLRFVEIIDAINPRVFVGENVPGWLSTSDNAFGCFLGALAGADAPLVPARGQRWTDAGMVVGPRRRLAWRILDAQYFGVAQRRERVFVVGCPLDGEDPAEVLLECESLRRYPPTRRKAGQGITHEVANSLVSSGRGVERGGGFQGPRSNRRLLRGGELSSDRCIDDAILARLAP